MAIKSGARPGRLLALALIAAAFAAALGGGVAIAAEAPEDPVTIEQVFEQLQNTPVYKEACTTTCHGNIAQTKNYASAIIFQHGYHQLVACSSCHSRFPHRPEATIERPTMQGCFDCHGVRHGPMGIIATDKCEDCHVTPKERLRPAFHTYDWAGKAHVDPSNKEFNTKCAMCHKPSSCTDCHDYEGVNWTPAKGWDYDSTDGCLACHGSATLSKTAQGGVKSFTVTGVMDSAHSDLSCQSCHTDYRYDDKPGVSELWTINAGQACADCHAKSENKESRQAVEEYQQSVHAQQLAEGNTDSATCASCHGGHFIYRLDTELAQARMHGSSYRTCARCHDEEYGTYDDYYHGAAYKAGAPDAPACWECHGSHKVLPNEDKESTISEENVAATCGTEGCHTGTSAKFGADAAELIHDKVKAEESNPLLKLISGFGGE